MLPSFRPKQVHVTAYDLQGNEFNATVDGMMARVIQHEFDHVQGVLFTDRLSESAKGQVDSLLYEFEIAFDSKRDQGGIPADDAIKARLRELEAKYA